MNRLIIFLSFLFFPLFSFAKDDVANEISMLRSAADSLHSIGKTDSAVLVGDKAIRLAEKSGKKILLLGAYSGQGVYLRSLGKINEALKSYERGLEIVTSEEFRKKPSVEEIEEIASLYINLAVLNLDMQHKEDAVKNALTSADWCEKSKDPEFKSTVLGVVGSVLTGCGDLKNALKYQEAAYIFALEAKDEEAAFRSASYNMLICNRLGKKQEEDEWRKRCESLFSSVDASMAKLVYYQAECSICLKNNDKKGSLKWFNKILELDGIDNLPFVKFDVYNNMHIAYADVGDFNNAYNILLKSNELRDSLWEKEKTESLQDLTIKYETKETQLALAQSEAKRARVLMWLFIVIGILLVMAVLFVIYASRQRDRRMQNEIEYANLRADVGRQLTEKYIEGLENERMRMAKELHDGICNDLLAVELNMNNGQSIEAASKLIESCRESVRRISHELMPPEFSYASIDEVIRFLVYKQSEANKDKIKFGYKSEAHNIDWNEISDSVSLEIYRVAQEIIGNAVKHSGATEISVELFLNSERILLEIKDNGNYGLHNLKSSNGVGIESVKKRAKSIDGLVDINVSPTGGMEFLLTVNHKKSNNSL